jgi:hypothetical protein
MTVGNEMERMRRELVMASFNVLTWHLPGRTEIVHKNLKKMFWLTFRLGPSQM